MRQAAEEDRVLNEKQLPATKKIAMLEMAMSQINKHNLIEGFLDANILSALTDWLAPMPDRSLPAAKIREAVIKWLVQVQCSRQLYNNMVHTLHWKLEIRRVRAIETV